MAFATPSAPGSQPQSGNATYNPTVVPRSAVVAPPGGLPQSKPRQAHQQYQRSQIETASPTRLVIMLYDGAIRFCTLGQEAMQKRAIETQNTNLVKAQSILAELMSSLDRNAGGEVAENLFQLYTYMLEQLVTANLFDRPAPIGRVIEMLRGLRESWLEVDRLTTQGQGQEPQAQKPAVGTPPTAMGSLPTPSASGRTPASAPAAKTPVAPLQKPMPQPPAISRLGNRDA